MKRIRVIFAGLLILGAFIGAVSPVYAVDAGDSVCAGLGQVGQGGCTDESGVNSLVATTVSILSYILGVVAILMIIFGAMKYMTSGGDGNAVAAAKKTILYALVGLVIAVSGQALVRLVLNRSTHLPPSASGQNGNCNGTC